MSSYRPGTYLQNSLAALPIQPALQSPPQDCLVLCTPSVPSSPKPPPPPSSSTATPVHSPTHPTLSTVPASKRTPRRFPSRPPRPVYLRTEVSLHIRAFDSRLRLLILRQKRAVLRLRLRVIRLVGRHGTSAPAVSASKTSTRYRRLFVRTTRESVGFKKWLDERTSVHSNYQST